MFSVSTRAGTDGSPVVSLAGDLDITTAESLDETLSSVLSSHPTSVVFDLSELRFMDSAGIAILVRAARATSVYVRSPSRATRRIIELSGLRDVLQIEP